MSSAKCTTPPTHRRIDVDARSDEVAGVAGVTADPEEAPTAGEPWSVVHSVAPSESAVGPNQWDPFLVGR